jgi:hypothetical protein
MRWPALLLVPALLAGLWLLDDDDPAPAAPEPDSQVLGPLVAGDESLGAVWFCAGGTGTPDGVADHQVIVVNTTDAPRRVSMRVYGSRSESGEKPEPVPVETDLPPYGRSVTRLGELMPTAYVSATVEVDGGGVLVEHRLSGPQGVGLDQAPCSSTASPSWTVPIGATDTIDPATAKARELLVFFNPYPADAVLDVHFSTTDGVRDPDVFNGFVVSGRSVSGIDLAAVEGGRGVTVATEVAAEVTARAGRVVVDRIQLANDPEVPRAGLAVSSGVPAAAESWTFAVGGQNDALREQLAVYNPSDEPAEVDVEVRPDSSGGSQFATEPFELTIQPHRHELLDLANEERMSELRTASMPYTLVVRSADGTLVTAERSRWSTPGAPGGGLATSTGTALAARRLVGDMTGAESGSQLVLVNPSTETVAGVRLSIVAFADAATGEGRRTDPLGPGTYELPPGGRRAIPVDQIGTGSFVVIVESDVPVLGERDVVIGTERFIAAAVPDADTAVVAQPSLFADALGS